MNSFRHDAGWLLLTLCAALMWLASAFGQASSNLPPTPGAQASRTNSAPPPLPMTRSPVEYFRELLVMPASEQQAYLSVRPPQIREKILEKVAEYHALPPEERELRLKATELRWYLMPLLQLTETNRADQLALVPLGMRELVESRLGQWDRLSRPVQSLLLNDQQAVGVFGQVQSASPQPPSPVEKIRNKLFERFNQLFELTPEEKEKVLGSLSDAERRQMESTLQSFEQLPPEKRQRCIQAFSKFAALTAVERQEFLKNAERWSQMSPTERQAWRELVSIAPILPPMPPPPFPRLPARNIPAPLVTNGN